MESVLAGALWERSRGVCQGKGDNYTALILTRWQTAMLSHSTLSCGAVYWDFKIKIL